jgi:hypothetical protein
MRGPGSVLGDRPHVLSGVKAGAAGQRKQGDRRTRLSHGFRSLLAKPGRVKGDSGHPRLGEIPAADAAAPHHQAVEPAA